MTNPTIAIIQFPGSNCERETILAVKRAGMQAKEFMWNESPIELDKMQGFIIVGGFSYEDRSRAGIIAALAPIMQELKIQSAKGKPILGICNGAQILVESGLVPGLENHKLGLSLTENKRVQNGKVIGTGYYNTWIHLKLSDQYQRNAFTKHLSSKNILHMPIAHAEGRFVMTDALLAEIQHQGLNIFQYCDANGTLVNEFPINPNGSIENIAAISNKAGNVLAIMPHPERTENGDAIFRSMHDYIIDLRYEDVPPLAYYPRQQKLKVYNRSPNSLLVKLIITDNQAVTVQNTLQQLDIPVEVKRYVYWEIASLDETNAEKLLQDIFATGLLCNERKEVLVPMEDYSHEILQLLVRPKEDFLGLHMQQKLQNHYKVKGISALFHGVVWQFFSKNVTISNLKDKILNTNIVSNPYAHDCLEFRNCLS